MKKRLLILGASGFIGKNIAIYFSKKNNFKVTGTYFRNKTKIKGVKLLKCDLTKNNQLTKLQKILILLFKQLQLLLEQKILLKDLISMSMTIVLLTRW